MSGWCESGPIAIMPTPPVCWGPLKAVAIVGLPGAKAPPGAKQALRLGAPGTKGEVHDEPAYCVTVSARSFCTSSSAPCLENDAVIVDAVSAAYDGLALGRTDPRQSRRGGRSPSCPDSSSGRSRSPSRCMGWRATVVRFGHGSWALELPVRLESYSQRRPRLSVRRGVMRQSSCT